LKYLYCSSNQLTNIDYLPYGLEYLICAANNNIKNLNNLLKSIKILSCSGNSNIMINVLPNINKIFTNKELDVNLDNIKVICK
jgi:Leucine-rich repeat (LRR) protein